MNYKIKKFRNENYFVLYDLSDNIVCYFNDFNELSKFVSYSLRDLIHEYNKYKTMLSKSNNQHLLNINKPIDEEVFNDIIQKVLANMAAFN